jgi:SAM-dependent methyltransferase
MLRYIKNRLVGKAQPVGPVIDRSQSLEFRNETSIYNNIRWTIGSISCAEGLKFSGWALHAQLDEAKGLPLYLNGEPLKNVNFPKSSPGVHNLLPSHAVSKCCLFECEVDIPAEQIFDKGFAEISYRPYGLTNQQVSRNAFYYFDPTLQASIPEIENIYRVIGSEDIDNFLFTGATAYNRIKNYLRDQLERPLDTFNAVLDWGCGAGRLTRYLAMEEGPTITGADIDEFNVDWCSKAIENVRFEKFPLQPPTQSGEGSFDLVIGISIFTHLREHDQNAWLAELQRIVRPGGIVMVSYHGPTIMGLVRAREPLLERIEAEGIVVTGQNKQVTDIGDEEYYVNVSHSQTYIEQNWSRYFDIIDIVPALLGRQDMVVMRRR